MISKSRQPTLPGAILLEEFLRPMGLTQTRLAARMKVSPQRVNTLINGNRAVTAETALLLAKILGTSPEFWLNLQMTCDLNAAVHRRRARTG